MPDNSSSNKRIAKNTLLLYLRMLLVLGLNLYISRMTLQYLGIEDFGIYNIVCSVVVLFSYLNSALSLAATRFISYELKNGIDRQKVVFNTCLIIQILFAVCILLLLETVGIWFVNHKLIIPEERMIAANVVFQLSILTTILSIIRVPYEASIVAYERIGVFAILSIAEVILKLCLVLTLAEAPFDILTYYGTGLCIIAVFSFFLRYFACIKWFDECRVAKKYDKNLFKSIFAFTGWNVFGATAGVCVGQGINIIINIFFGPVVNAARGIAIQAEGAINSFVTNINTAVNPQIVKRYSVGDRNGMYSLVFFASKVSFMLLLIISMPIFVDTHYILNLWLGSVPDYACEMTRIELLYMLSLTLTYSINMSAQASGHIKYFQIIEGSIMLLCLPISYIICRIDGGVEVVLLPLVFLSIIAFFAKLVVLNKTMKFPVKEYLIKVLPRIIFFCVFGFIAYFLFAPNGSSTLAQFSLKALIYTTVLLLLCFMVGMEPSERQLIKLSVLKFVKKKEL